MDGWNIGKLFHVKIWKYNAMCKAGMVNIVILEIILARFKQNNPRVTYIFTECLYAQNSSGAFTSRPHSTATPLRLK